MIIRTAKQVLCFASWSRYDIYLDSSLSDLPRAGDVLRIGSEESYSWFYIDDQGHLRGCPPHVSLSNELVFQGVRFGSFCEVPK